MTQSFFCNQYKVEPFKLKNKRYFFYKGVQTTTRGKGATLKKGKYKHWCITPKETLSKLQEKRNKEK